MITGDSLSTVNNVFLFVLIISVVLLVSITTTMIYFVIKYNKKKNPHPTNIASHTALEITWIVVPTIIVLAMFYYGWSGFRMMRTVPEDALEVEAMGSMWSWQFTYDNGKKSGELKVPVGRPVKLIITSEDVLHSLYIPAFRVKEAAVPGKVNYLWFLPEKEGEFDLFCSEYCGAGHSSMVSHVIAMPSDEFSAWMHGSTVAGTDEPPTGEVLLAEKGCIGCHTTDGSHRVGPTFKGIFGRDVVVITGGEERKIIIDESYLKRSILHPHADVVKGFPDIMPDQQDNVNEEEISQIIIYLKRLN